MPFEQVDGGVLAGDMVVGDGPAMFSVGTSQAFAPEGGPLPHDSSGSAAGGPFDTSRSRCSGAGRQVLEMIQRFSEIGRSNWRDTGHGVLALADARLHLENSCGVLFLIIFYF